MTGLPTKATDRFSETTIDDETVVMSLDSGDFFSLTGTAIAIWRHIDSSRSRDVLVADLAAEYGVAPDVVADDVDAFLAQLGAAGLIEAF